jgi:hypothetical protein
MNEGLVPVLVPPDHTRCQALEHNGYNFMTLGGRPGYLQCERLPRYIGTEAKAGPDGLIGSMSICEEHAFAMVKQLGEGFTVFAPINQDAPE